MVVDEYTRECLAGRIGRRPNLEDVIDGLVDFTIMGGTFTGEELSYVSRMELQ